MASIRVKGLPNRNISGYGNYWNAGGDGCSKYL